MKPLNISGKPTQVLAYNTSDVATNTFAAAAAGYFAIDAAKGYMSHIVVSNFCGGPLYVKFAKKDDSNAMGTGVDSFDLVIADSSVVNLTGCNKLLFTVGTGGTVTYTGAPGTKNVSVVAWNTGT